MLRSAARATVRRQVKSSQAFPPLTPEILKSIKEEADPYEPQPNQAGASASHRAAGEGTPSSCDTARRPSLSFPKWSRVRP